MAERVILKRKSLDLGRTKYMQRTIHLNPGQFLAALVLAAGLALGNGAALAQDCKRGPGAKVQTSKIVNFDLNSAEIKPEDQAELRKIAERMAGNPSLEICVLGMTDRTGSADYNKKLALRRAETVADFLKSAGLKDNAYQIVARGQAYGDDSWIGKLLGDTEKLSDRRVDVVFIGP